MVTEKQNVVFQDLTLAPLTLAPFRPKKIITTYWPITFFDL